MSNVAQAAAAASLRDQDELDRRVGVNRLGRAGLAAGLKDLGFHPLPSHANFVAVKVGGPTEFVRRLEAECVVVLPIDAIGCVSSTLSRPFQR
ncbi:aminotransferase class I/II-fold pyridoxal phosphate-dependent enzyme [Arthrobacter sp. 24S4-2]|nr:aminotransferase class I/II-fold pyridoxal phosphate-dependent enzyme [Arthrobacter sp. 24S4-2]